MSVLNKIRNKLSSKSSLYATPHLNFEYTAKTLHVKSLEKNIEILQNHKKQILTRLENVKKRNSELSEKMLTEELSEREVEIFSNTFSEVDKLNNTLERIKQQEHSLYNNSEESFFDK